MTLLGYASDLSAAPGESVDFMVYSDAPTYTVRMVRLIHGDRNPEGPGFKQDLLDSPVDGQYRGRKQATDIGSYATVEGLPSLKLAFGLTAWIYPTVLEEWPRPQCIFSRVASSGRGFDVRIEDGHLTLRLFATDHKSAAQVLTADEPLKRNCWYFIYAGLDIDGGAALEWATEAWLPSAGCVTSASGLSDWEASGPLCMAAAARSQEGIGAAYNGKISSPRLFDRALSAEERGAVREEDGSLEAAREALVAAWNLGSDPSTNRFRDDSGRGHDGELFNRPMSAVTDHRWDGTSVDWKTRPDQYQAVFFHATDLADAQWEADFSWSVPPNLPSGQYAAWLTAGDHEDHIPITVRPPRTHATAEIGVLMPTFTYLAYANERERETVEGFGEIGLFPSIEPDPREADLAEHPEWGVSLYDVHPDGAGACYSSAKRPILNLRPDYKMWAVRAPRHLGADLYMIDWLREKKFRHDTFTDHDLHFDGSALLERYRVIITGGHPEYWSGQMLDALRTYLDNGGRLMYLGGNGFYWVTSIDAANPHIIEVRRGYNGSRTWESAPGEGYHSTTGEHGGLWRYRGRDPNRMVGVGFASQGWSLKAPGYKAVQDRDNPIVQMFLEGVDESPIGEYGLVMGGAAGDEIDRADRRHGSPEHLVVLASSTGHDDHYQLVIEDVTVTLPGLGGTEHPDVRSDITFLETPNDGAVFAAGSICWRGSLSYNQYDNGVSRITENALRALLTVETWPRASAA